MKLLAGIWATQIFLWIGACYRTEGPSNFIKYFLAALTINIFIFAAISLINLAAFYVVTCLELSASQVKGKRIFGNAKWISLSLLAAAMLGIFYMVNLTSLNYQRLEEKKQGLEFWNQSKSIFKIEYSEYNPAVWHDLVPERKTNDKLSRFYETAKKSGRSFYDRIR